MEHNNEDNRIPSIYQSRSTPSSLDEGTQNEDEDEDGHFPRDDKLFIAWRRLQLSKAKLKGVTEMAALMAGFSVIATVELQIRCDTSEMLLVTFTVTTALLVSTTMLSIMIATCILPHIDAVAKLDEDEEMRQLMAKKMDCTRRRYYEGLTSYIDLAWFLANTASISLFLVDMILLSWIKFPDILAISITCVMIPVLILLFLFSILFYRETIHHQINIADKKIDELKALSVRLRIGSVGSGNNDEDRDEDDELREIRQDYPQHHHQDYPHPPQPPPSSPGGIVFKTRQEYNEMVAVYK